MKHLRDEELALYAGGELGFVDRWKFGSHIRHCDQCQEEVGAYREASAYLRTALDRIPEGANWDRLAADMSANIRLGVEAGAIVGNVSRRRENRMGWRAAAVLAAMTCILLVAWWLNPPVRRPSAHTLTAAGKAQIRSTSSGIELNENGHALTLRTRGRQRPIIVSAPGTLRARFVDDSGQVTINNVHTD